MTKEEKELLTKCLCDQYPYGVQVEIEGYYSGILRGIYGDTVSTDRGNNYPLRLVKPYLRPMSSITEGERKERYKFSAFNNIEFFDWINAHHFDSRGLIEMGLAIAAVGNNNPYKEKGSVE